MKYPSALIAVAGLVAALTAGCGHLDLTPEGDPSRVLTGTVEFREPLVLPPDATVVVRVVDPKRETESSPTAVLGEPSMLQPRSALPPKILGEQVLHHPGPPPISFRIEYTALDEQLRRGLNVEARISFDGRVRFFNVNSYAITLNNFGDPHTVWVNRIER